MTDIYEEYRGANPVAFLRQDTYKATKNYLCDDCGQVITKGTVYIYTACMFEGEFKTTRSHTFSGECIEDLDEGEPISDIENWGNK